MFDFFQIEAMEAMKRGDDSRLIKIPDVSSANISVAGKPPIQPSAASIAPVFPQRPLQDQRPAIHELPPQPPSATMPPHPIQAHRTGVTIFRGEPLSASMPPAAHTGVVVTATPAQPGVGPPGPPASVVPHGPNQPIPQPTAASIKTETISKHKLFLCWD